MKLIRLLAAAMAGAAALVLRRRRTGRLRLDRARAALRLATRGGPATRATRRGCPRPRVSGASSCERTWPCRPPKTSSRPLGAMKGVMMKSGQMASYVDDGLSPAVRHTLARLQDSVPPMSPELAAAVVEDELGAPPERAFVRWDPSTTPCASQSH